MDSARAARSKYTDLYSEMAAVPPPSEAQIAAARRTAAAAAHDAADLAVLLDALGIGFGQGREWAAPDELTA